MGKYFALTHGVRTSSRLNQSINVLSYDQLETDIVDLNNFIVVNFRSKICCNVS